MYCKATKADRNDYYVEKLAMKRSTEIKQYLWMIEGLLFHPREILVEGNEERLIILEKEQKFML